VCDHYVVSYSPSLAIITRRWANETKCIGNSAYVVVNPQDDPRMAFASIEAEAIADQFARNPNRRGATNNVFCFDEANMNLNKPGWSLTGCEVEKGRAATKATVCQNVYGRTYIHFACHGFYNWGQPWRSALKLSDGEITLSDLFDGSCDLRAVCCLVTLSACETGLTDIRPGREDEYLGLAAGFLRAGVPCVVASLWCVHEISTALIFERFYTYHLSHGLDVATALRAAQLAVREMTVAQVADYFDECTKRRSQRNNELLHALACDYRNWSLQQPHERPFAHPYYWAGFVSVGRDLAD